jgi:hypothetical protein
MYPSSKQLDIVIDMMDTKLSHMLVDGCENAEELDTVKRRRLALRTARAASRRRDRQHRSRLAVLALPILLNACALPASFSIASLAIDGISYATSGKSVSDHAISAVANEDCAMWRALQARPICRDRDVPETMVAAAPESEVPAAVLAAAPAAGGSTAPEIAITETHDEFEVTAAAFAAAPAAGDREGAHRP